MVDLFTIKGTATQGTLAKDALSARHGYQAMIEDGDGDSIPNPESKTDFSKRQVLEWIKNEVKAYRVDQFAVGRKQVVDDADVEVDGISVD